MIIKGCILVSAVAYTQKQKYSEQTLLFWPLPRLIYEGSNQRKYIRSKLRFLPGQGVEAKIYWYKPLIFQRTRDRRT